MELDVLTLSHYLEIARIVVSLITIDVVHDLTRHERSPELLLSDHTMLVSTVVLRIRRSIRLEQRLTLTLALLRLKVDRPIDSDDLLGSALAIGLTDVS
jgi:hypothetical protein